MRLLGDQYIKAEFRAHRNVENPVHIVCLLELELTTAVREERVTANVQLTDWILDGMADVCAKVGRGFLDWGTYGC
jgi:hypothetical protein